MKQTIAYVLVLASIFGQASRPSDASAIRALKLQAILDEAAKDPEPDAPDPRAKIKSAAQSDAAMVHIKWALRDDDRKNAYSKIQADQFREDHIRPLEGYREIQERLKKKETPEQAKASRADLEHKRAEYDAKRAAQAAASTSVGVVRKATSTLWAFASFFDCRTADKLAAAGDMEGVAVLAKKSGREVAVGVELVIFDTLEGSRKCRAKNDESDIIWVRAADLEAFTTRVK